MPDEPRVQELLDELIDREATPEEVCGACLELLPVVRERWRQICRARAELDALLPVCPHGTLPTMPPEELPLPQVPGYDVEAVLGRGGMGVVYKARHLALKRTIALKMLASHSHAAERARFRAEAEAVARLQHPNVVQIHEVGEVDGRPFIALEYVSGGSLAERLAGRPLPPCDAARLVAALAEAMHLAHSRNLVHRDLKPGNVLLAGEADAPVGQCLPKVTDFGLVRQLDADSGQTFDGVVMGTPSYMAPEQAEGRARSAGPAADVYALGAILYECLTGRPPFEGATPLETLEQVRSREPAAPAALNRQAPRDLETICLKCLRKQPERRYSSARELADDLGRFVRGEPVRARPVGPVERLYKWAWRRPTQAAAWFGAVAALGAILASILWTTSQQAAISRAVLEDLAEVVRLEEASDWHAARNMLERARTRLGAAAERYRTAHQVSERERELDLVDRLSTLRFDRASRDLEESPGPGWAKSWQMYRNLFSEAGFLHEGDSAASFAASVARSPARAALVSAMDDWAVCATDRAELEWLLSAARLADPDPPWRDKARNAATWKDRDALAALAQEASVDRQPVALLLTVAGRLLGAGSTEAEPLLRRVQAAHASDFWANFALAEVLDARGDAESIGFYRAALSLRPDAVIARLNLGLALETHGRRKEALDHLRRAADLDPNSFVVQFNLAASLLEANRNDEALEHARNAARIDPQQHVAQRLLGRALAMTGKYCEAAECFQRALEKTPDDDKLREFLALALKRCKAAGDAPPASQRP